MSEIDGTDLDIAIIGMSGRFPGAEDVDAFWQNLRDGVESITLFTDAELLAAGTPPDSLRDPRLLRAKGVVAGSDQFDARFFNIAPSEAALRDPQHRVFLECAWAALEDAGYDPQHCPGPVGVYAGAGLNTYLLHNLYPRHDIRTAEDGFSVVIGNDKDFLASYVSYMLNLEGPAIVVQTACSTSLVAVHLACQSILAGECSMALAGGVSLTFPQRRGYLYQEGMILSPDGHCRAFDARANGTVSGEGVGIVVLKRREDAQAGGDRIRALIKGSAVNNDGRAKVGYTAPRIEGQARVIQAAQAAAGVAPGTITYIETHGTGTPLGDPIEIKALARAFPDSASMPHRCALGSVKTNIGHLDAASGIAGLIKTVLALEHKQIPPSLHFQELNPQIDLADTPFYVNARLSAWTSVGTPRRAGVSSFGIGGTNAHVILEESPPVPPAGPRRRWQVLPLSTRSAAALEIATDQLARHTAATDAALPDIAYTLQTGRAQFEWRRIVLCENNAQAARALASRDASRVLTAQAPAVDPPTVFMFPGQGAQYPRMASDLYDAEPDFRAEVDRCAGLLAGHLEPDLRQVLFGSAHDLSQTWLAQPSLFVVEYSLARMWMAWGIEPESMIGHSIGEYVAACLAEVFSLPDALALVAARGRLMQALPKGGMLAVALAERDLEPLLGDQLSLAASNGPALSVVSGPETAIAALQGRLAERGIEASLLRTSHAFHSSMVEPALHAYREVVRGVRPQAPRIPFISCVTGTWITDAQALDPEYWVSQTRQTVRFAAGVEELLRDPARIFLEVGPGRTLGNLARQQPQDGKPRLVLASLANTGHLAQEADPIWLRSLGQLWLAGKNVNWTAFAGAERPLRVPLPTYPFQRQRYWIGAQSAAEPAVSKREDPRDWLYLPSWKRSLAPGPRLTNDHVADKGWLLFCDGCGWGEALARRLERAGAQVTLVRPGATFERLSEQEYAIEPEQSAHYVQLLNELEDRDLAPDCIVHLWGITRASAEAEPESFNTSQALGFGSVLCLVQALVTRRRLTGIAITVLSEGVHQVTGQETISPANAMVLGVCKVVPQEYPGLVCRNIDLDTPRLRPGDWQTERLLEVLLAELTGSAPEPVVAYRAGQRWVPAFEPIRPDLTRADARLRQEGVYLITGGLGALGLAFARHLAHTVQARLVLVSRTGLPPREQWAALLTQPAERQPEARQILAVQEMEAAGAQVLVLRGDVSDLAGMQRVVAEAEQRFGSIHGVIYASGISGDGAYYELLQSDRQVCERHYPTKVAGVAVLETLLAGRSLDFCILCSSLAAVLGGVGFAAYAAANIYLDVFVQQHNRRSAQRWTSVDWDGWRFEAADTLASRASGTAALALTEAQGIEAWRGVLALETCEQVIVSTGALEARAGQWLAGAAPAYERLPEETRARPERGSSPAPARDRREQQVIEIWQELLGIAPIGVDDDFFSLGGHSLLAIRLVSRLRETFHVELPVRAVFDAPTVAGVARAVAEQATAQTDMQRVAAALVSLHGGEGYPGSEPIPLPPSAALDGHDLRAQNRQIYAALNRKLNATIYGTEAVFLNYGLAGTPRRARVQLPDRYPNRNAAQLVLELIGPLELDGRRILDVGCGRGGTVALIARHYHPKFVVGLDLSPEAIAFCRRSNRSAHARFQTGDAESLPFADGSLDVVMNIESSHSYANLNAFYSDVWRVLARDGWFLYTDLLPTERWDASLAMLSDLGFFLEENRDITADVLRSCRETAAWHLEAFGEEGDREFMADFVALPGSRVYDEMLNGRSAYRILRLHKALK